MKTRIISNLKKKVLLVSISTEDGTDPLYIAMTELYINSDAHKVSPGNWQFLSRLSEVTEEQILSITGEKFCDRCALDNKGVHGVPGGYVAGCEGSRCDETRETIQESFLSALEASNVMFSNPHGDQPSYFTLPNSDLHSVTWVDLMTEWRQAEANVFSPNQTLIFVEQ